MKTFRDFREIIVKHSFIGDGALLFLIVGSAFFVQPAYWGLQPPYLNAFVTIISSLLAIIPLAWRRYSLITALIFVAITSVGPDVFNIISRVNLSSVASTIAVFSKASHGGRKRNLICFVSIIAFNGGLVYKIITSGDAVFLSSANLFNIVGLFWNLLTFSAIWWFGNKMRASREQTSLLSTRVEQVVKGNQQNERWAVFYKLSCITQWLCVILLYNIRITVIQARAAHQVLKQYPDKALNSLNRIKQSIRNAVVEVHCIFNHLWNEKHFDLSAAKSDLQQLVKLATDVQTPGLQVKVKIEGEKREAHQTA
jgi:hypothetical protein